VWSARRVFDCANDRGKGRPREKEIGGERREKRKRERERGERIGEREAREERREEATHRGWISARVAVNAGEGVSAREVAVLQ